MRNYTETIYFAKVKNDSIIPTKREEDGCFDLYACFEENEIIIPPHEIKLIPTGIASSCCPRYRFAIRERGSNTKSKLIVIAGQIDSGYRGEWFVALYNTQHIPVEISASIDEYEYTEDFIRIPYSKAIAQFAIEEVPIVIQKEIPYDELKDIKSDRAMGMLGSTSK